MESGLFETSGWEVDPDFPFPDDFRDMSKDLAAQTKKEQSELMEDKAVTRIIEAKMDFLGSRKEEELEVPRPKSKKNTHRKK